MNEYHLIASNDHFTKREKNIDINKLKASLANSDYTDLTADMDDDTLQILQTHPGFYISKTNIDNQVLVSSRCILSIDISGHHSVEISDGIKSMPGVSYFYMLDYDGYRLALNNEGRMIVQRQSTEIADIDIQCWWQFKSMTSDRCSDLRVKSMPSVVGKWLFAVCGSDRMDLCRIDIDAVCRDAVVGCLGPASTYRHVFKEDVQAFCLDMTKKYIYVVDVDNVYERKLTLSGNQVAISKGNVNHFNRWCFSVQRFFLVCSMDAYAFTSKQMTVTLYTPNLRELHKMEMTSTQNYLPTTTLLVDIDKSKSPLFIAFDLKYRISCYSLFKNRICQLVQESNICTPGMTNDNQHILDRSASDSSQISIFHMSPYKIEKSSKLTILMTGFTRQIRNYSMCTYIAKMTICL